jgi:hypothetical protein
MLKMPKLPWNIESPIANPMPIRTTPEMILFISCKTASVMPTNGHTPSRMTLESLSKPSLEPGFYVGSLSINAKPASAAEREANGIARHAPHPSPRGLQLSVAQSVTTFRSRASDPKDAPHKRNPSFKDFARVWLRGRARRVRLATGRAG